MALKCVRFQSQSQSLLSVGRRTLDGKAGDGSSVVRIRGVGGGDHLGGFEKRILIGRGQQA